MLERLKKIAEGNNSVSEFTDSVRHGVPSAVFGVSESFRCYLISALAEKEKVLFLVKDNVVAEKYRSLISEMTDKKVAVLPAKDETLICAKAFSKDAVYSRITVRQIIKDCDVCIATCESAMQKFSLKTETVRFVKGQEYVRDEYLSKLVLIGYKRCETAESKGTFVIRGDSLEIFPINCENPFHVDFFGDEAESIREFDADTHKIIKYVDEIEIYQATETVFSDADLSLISSVVKNEAKKAPNGVADRLKEKAEELIFAVELRDFDALSIAQGISENCCDISKILDENAVVVIDEGKKTAEVCNLVYTEFSERFEKLYKEGETFSFSKKNTLSFEELKQRFSKFRIASVSSLSSVNPFFNPLKIINPSVGGVADYKLSFPALVTDLCNWARTGYTAYIYAGSEKRAENLVSDLISQGVPVRNDKLFRGGVFVFPERLSDGFVFHEEQVAFIGCENVFVKERAKKKVRYKKQTYFTAPETGDYCVHETHGIGRVLGNRKISTTEGTKDYVAVEYQSGDVLYVPVEQMDILTRYLGGEKTPKLSKLGGKDFEKVRERVKESIKKMSFDLRKLYEERNKTDGYAFKEDDELMSLFTSAFPYEETPDQITAFSDIESDMTSGKVMDRLVCGDVGFGKTEVALRAVFLCAINDKQSAMLAPTTILTEQHYNTAKERFSKFGLKIAVLNRFRSPQEVKEILKGLEDGSINFVIGTHALLGKNVKFKDLGLLILDEEQRFGVEHKEKIKLLKKNVDTLTLTATPIPRTLHMSLSGIRPISDINTPPKKRLPVQTYVTEESDALIKDAITREINRGGQVFILYNRVESIFTFAEKIKAIVQGVEITVAHGRMEEKTLENNIMEFYQGKTKVLVSTTIIENGIDLPSANTLIVIDADRLGLSTLYQLKGRVGRSDRLAYAYFTYKRETVLTDTAYNRLNAIKEFTEMGSGIKIAMRDLEIRGAGNVLGAEQHGHMDKIGYELYSKLLKEEIDGKEEYIPDLDVRVDAFIPEDYISGDSARMGAYKEIAEIDGVEAEKTVREELTSAFGALPEPVENLIDIAMVKFLARPFGVSGINVKKESVNLTFSSLKNFADERLSDAVKSSGGEAYFSVANMPKIEFARGTRNNKQMLDALKKFLITANGGKSFGTS